MSTKPPESQRLANTASDLLYGIAGWIMIGLGILGIVVQAGYVVNGLADPVLTPAVVLISIVAVLFGVFVNPRFRRRLNRRHSFTEFGRVRSVDERALHATEGETERCVNCGSYLDEGLVRRYREEICFAGIPILTTSEDHNHYCVECAADEMGVSIQSGSDQSDPKSSSKNESDLTAERN